MDCDQHKDLAATYKVKGFPTIKIFAGNKREPIDYAGTLDLCVCVLVCVGVHVHECAFGKVGWGRDHPSCYICM